MTEMWYLAFAAATVLTTSIATPLFRQVGLSDDVQVLEVNGSFVCQVEGTYFQPGADLPTLDPCEYCVCKPPGIACQVVKCQHKPECRSLQRSDLCCPEYICDCDKNGKIYMNGARIDDMENPCEVCYCETGEVKCSVIQCHEVPPPGCIEVYVEGQCCPSFDCTEDSEDKSQVTSAPVEIRDDVNELVVEIKNDVTDTPLELRDDVTDEAIETRVDVTEIPVEAQDDVTDTPIETRDDVTDVPIETRKGITDTSAYIQFDDATDAPVAMRDDVTDVPVETRNDVTDAPIETRDDVTDVPYEIKSDVTDVPVETRVDMTDVSVETRNDVTDAPIETIDDVADVPNEIKNNIIDAPVETRNDATEIPVETKNDATDVAMRDDVTDVPVETRDDVTDAPVETRDDDVTDVSIDTKDSVSNVPIETKEDIIKSNIKVLHETQDKLEKIDLANINTEVKINNVHIKYDEAEKDESGANGETSNIAGTEIPLDTRNSNVEMVTNAPSNYEYIAETEAPYIHVEDKQTEEIDKTEKGAVELLENLQSVMSAGTEAPDVSEVELKSAATELPELESTDLPAKVSKHDEILHEAVKPFGILADTDSKNSNGITESYESVTSAPFQDSDTNEDTLESHLNADDKYWLEMLQQQEGESQSKKAPSDSSHANKNQEESSSNSNERFSEETNTESPKSKLAEIEIPAIKNEVDDKISKTDTEIEKNNILLPLSVVDKNGNFDATASPNIELRTEGPELRDNEEATEVNVIDVTDSTKESAEDLAALVRNEINEKIDVISAIQNANNNQKNIRRHWITIARKYGLRPITRRVKKNDPKKKRKEIKENEI